MDELEKLELKRTLWKKGLSLQLVEEYNEMGESFTTTQNPVFKGIDRGIFKRNPKLSDIGKCAIESSLYLEFDKYGQLQKFLRNGEKIILGGV